ncbi:integrase [Cedecea sp. NFIX57]|nr:integrase [Cedecea sp. NFIX57]
MTEKNGDQIAILNSNFDFSAPSLPHKKVVETQ